MNKKRRRFSRELKLDVVRTVTADQAMHSLLKLLGVCGERLDNLVRVRRCGTDASPGLVAPSLGEADAQELLSQVPTADAEAQPLSRPPLPRR